MDQVYDLFVQGLIQKLKNDVKIGDPMDKANTLGPLASQK